MNRDVKLSNVKGLLILLVVFGHLLSPYQKDYNGIYMTIFTFHMPLFILVSGYFAKHANLKKVLNMVMIYIIFQALYRWFQTTYTGKVFRLKLDVPYFQLWYLASMAVWYIAAIIINRLKLNRALKIIFIFMCFVAGIVSRYFTGTIVGHLMKYDADFDTHAFSYQRTISYAVFFFIGLFLTKANMHKFYNSLKKHLWIPIITIFAVITYFTLVKVTDFEKIIKCAVGIDEMKGDIGIVTVKMVLAYALAIVMCYAVINLVGNKKCILTKWGDQSMTVFLFHVFVTKTNEKYNILDDINKWLLLPLLFAIAVAVVCLLSSDIFVKCSYILCHPYDVINKIINKLKFSLKNTDKAV